MVDKRIIPQVMCDACGHIFPASDSSEPELTEEITCPACETQGKPKGIMQPTGFPSLETFQRNWKKSTSITVPTSDVIVESSETNKD